MRCILAATDLSTRSAVAVARADAIAAATGAELVIAHVVGDDLPDRILQRRVAEVRELLGDQLRALRTPAARSDVVAGEIFWGIDRLAADAGADLVVVGDHRRGWMREAFGDTTVERMIRVSSVPVLIARTPAAPAYRHAVVGVEDREAGELVGALAGLGAAAPAKATLFHAVTAPAAGLMYYAAVPAEAISDYSMEIVRAARSRIEAALPDAPFPIGVMVVEAAPIPAIAAYAARENCDLVAVSSHARRAVMRGLLGSVSSELIRHGQTDLLIVPRVAIAREQG